MSNGTQKNTFTHDDGIKRTEEQVIVRVSDEGNTQVFHGRGGTDGPHTSLHQDGNWYRTDADGVQTQTTDNPAPDAPSDDSSKP